MPLQSQPTIFAFDPKEQMAQPEHLLGTMAITSDGRVFRYAKGNASTDLDAGKLQLAPVPNTNHHNIAVASAAALNAKKVTVTLGNTAATADEYAEGFMVVNDAIGEGTSYKILTHPAADASASLELTLSEPITNTALTTASEVELIHNHWNLVLEGTTATIRPAGVPLVTVDVSETPYCWLQTKGPCPVEADENGNVGEAVTTGTSTAGAVEAEDWQLQGTDANRVIEEFRVGHRLVAATAEEHNTVDLCID